MERVQEHFFDSRTPPREEEYYCRGEITNSVESLQLDGSPPNISTDQPDSKSIGGRPVSSPISYLDGSIEGLTSQQKP